MLQVDLSTAFTPSKLSPKSTTTTITTANSASINKLSYSKWFRTRRILLNESSSSTSGTADGEVTKGPAPTFNGSMLPLKLTRIGLRGHKVAAVYAIFDKEYKSFTVDGEEWSACKYINLTRDLAQDVDKVCTKVDEESHYIRALSFAYPQRSAMEEVVTRWADLTKTAGGNTDWGDIDNVVSSSSTSSDSSAEKDEDESSEDSIAAAAAAAIYYDEDDEDDEFDELNDAGGVISPFSSEMSSPVTINSEESKDTDDGASSMVGEKVENLDFTAENVDKVLDEIRPYLISDGGNVAVQRVDEETRSVYLILEGACGSCSSSTVTMQMGIERVLKENFVDLGEVLQVEDESHVDANATELTIEAVEAEVKRIAPAIIALGGSVQIVSVEPTGEVTMKFSGSQKIKQGLELAVRDVPLVTEITFLTE